MADEPVNVLSNRLSKFFTNTDSNTFDYEKYRQKEATDSFLYNNQQKTFKCVCLSHRQHSSPAAVGHFPDAKKLGTNTIKKSKIKIWFVGDDESMNGPTPDPFKISDEATKNIAISMARSAIITNTFSNISFNDLLTVEKRGNDFYVVDHSFDELSFLRDAVAPGASTASSFFTGNPGLKMLSFFGLDPFGGTTDAESTAQLGTNLAKYFKVADRRIGDVKYVILHSTDGTDKKNAAQRTIDRFARGPTISYTDPKTGKKNPPCSDYPLGVPAGTICHPVRKNVEKPVQTSIHWAVDGHGGIVQGVLEKHIAIHAGGSKNKTSIGIEMCGRPNSNPRQGYMGKFSKMYNETMLYNTAKLVADICKRWKIEPNRQNIIGHYEFAGSRRSDPGDDPGEWDWFIFMNMVKQRM